MKTKKKKRKVKRKRKIHHKVKKVLLSPYTIAIATWLLPSPL